MTFHISVHSPLGDMWTLIKIALQISWDLCTFLCGLLPLQLAKDLQYKVEIFLCAQTLENVEYRKVIFSSYQESKTHLNSVLEGAGRIISLGHIHTITIYRRKKQYHLGNLSFYDDSQKLSDDVSVCSPVFALVEC